MKSEASLKENTAKGLLWSGFGNGIQQLLNLVFGIFLARLLNADDYGMVGMLTVFSAMAGVLQEGGFVSALNRRHNVTDNDYNSVFWLGLVVSVAIYVTFFFCAPLIARFYGVDELVPLSRFIFLGFLISSFGTVPGAYMFRNMMVRQRSIIAIVSLLLSGTVGVAMAACGYAYWGIATQTIVLTSTTVAMMYYYTRWHPKLHFDLKPIREMIGFSSKLIVTNAFTVVNNNIFPVLLGRLYTPYEVGNFTQAYKWNTMGSSLISNMLNSIAQPVFSKTETDTARQKNIFRKLLRFTAFISFPTMLTLSLVAEEFIVILLTEKWIESAHILRLLCVAGAFAPLSALFSNLLISRGQSSVFMRCTIALFSLLLLALFFAAPHGIHIMVTIYVCFNTGWLLVWHHFVRREIGLTLMETARDIAPYAGLTIVLIAVAQFAASPVHNIYASFALKVAVVAVGYCLLLWLLRSVIFREAILFITKKKITL